MPLLATANVNEVKVVSVNVDEPTPGHSPSEKNSSEPLTVLLRSLNPKLGIAREMIVLVPALKTDVFRLWSIDPPETAPTRERTIALPAAFRGVVQDDLFFVNIQFQNRWTWSMMDTGASRN